MRTTIGGKIAKFAPPLVAARNATLLVIKLNLFGIKKKIKNGPEGFQQKLRNTWQKLGGNLNKLSTAINSGKHGFDDFDFDSFEPVTTGTIVATSTPIIVKILKLLKDAGVSTEDVANGLKKLGKKGLEELAKKGKLKTDAAGNQYIDIPAPEIPETMGNNGPGTPVIIGIVAALAALYFISRK